MKASAKQRGEIAFSQIAGLLAFSGRSDEGAADVLRETFVSPVSAYAAGSHLLKSCGLHETDAELLSQIPDLARSCETSSFERLPVLASLDSAARYLCAHFFCLPMERFYLLCLDKQGRMMALILLQEGTEDGALFSMRRLLRETLRINPHAVVLSHNHPGGTLQPSREDIECTRAAIAALTGIGIPVLDHLIITRSTAVSMRGSGLIPEYQWLRQAPDCALLHTWLQAPQDKR